MTLAQIRTMFMATVSPIPHMACWHNEQIRRGVPLQVLG